MFALAVCAFTEGAAWATPSFVVSEPLVVPRRIVDFAVGDLNNDGLDDVAVLSRGSNKVSIVLIQQDSSFRQGVSIRVGTRLKSIGIGDFNVDGNGDLVVVSASKNTFIILGNGDGTFGAVTTMRRCCSGSQVVVGDFNDSNPGTKFPDDFAVSDPLNDDVNILYNKHPSSGVGFLLPGPRVTAGNRPIVLVAGDFSDDGETDIGALNFIGAGNDASSIINQGGGSFRNIGNFFAGKRARNLSKGDYNEDNALDLASSEPRNNIINLMPGLGGGLFGTGPTVPVSCAADQTDLSVHCNLRQTLIGDVDGDGGPDLTALISGPVSTTTTTGQSGGDVNAVLVFSGNGSGNFTGPVRFPNVGVNALFMKFGKFNADDRPDLVVGSIRDSKIRLLINNSGNVPQVTNTQATRTRTPTGTGNGNTPTVTPTECRGQGCPCDPENLDEDCNSPFFCAINGEVCCDTECAIDGVDCDLPGSSGICRPIDLPNGDECSVDEQCESGFCVDGVCCNRACTGATERCNINPGTCTESGTVRPTSTPTPTPPNGGSGTVTRTRTPTTRLKELGEDCEAGAECRSTFCPSEDLVCCNSACTGANEQCDLPGVKGQCLPINLPDGDNCIVDGQCISMVCEGGVCVGDDPNGTPTPKRSNGDQCTGGEQCESGFCPEDGVCCNEACDGENERCDLDPLFGTCLPIDLPDDSACVLDQQCLSRICIGNVCRSNGGTPVFTATRTPNGSRVPTFTRTATPVRQPTLILARGSGCSTADGNGQGNSFALLLAFPAWLFFSSRAVAPARRGRRRLR